MMTRTRPPVHQTIGDSAAAVVRISGVAVSPRRPAIPAAIRRTSAEAGREQAVSRRLKRTIRNRDHTRASRLPRTHTVASQGFIGNQIDARRDQTADTGSAATIEACAEMTPAMLPDCAAFVSKSGITGTFSMGGVTSLMRTSSQSR